MSNITEQSLHRIMVATFEELGLVVPDVELSPEQLEEPVDAAVSVAFRGPLSGRLILSASSKILPGLAANMLGTDNPDEATQRDALGELANVICGNLLPQVAGADVVFSLSAPQWFHTVDSKPDPRYSLAGAAALGIDEGRATAQVLLFGDKSSALEMRANAA